MSKHFEDARYYLGRAAEHAKAGVKEELEPVEALGKRISSASSTTGSRSPRGSTGFRPT